jgi:hypothetical protein
MYEGKEGAKRLPGQKTGRGGEMLSRDEGPCKGEVAFFHMEGRFLRIIRAVLRRYGRKKWRFGCVEVVVGGESRK